MRVVALSALLASAATACSSTGPGTGPDRHHGAERVASPSSQGARIAAALSTPLLPRDGGAFGAGRVQRVDGAGPGGAPAVRVEYPGGSSSTVAAARYGIPEGGAQTYLLLPRGPVTSLHLRYCLRFMAGFDFAKGGKLPGLFGGTVTSGQHIPDGTDGWSTRYMWRRGGAGEVYAYLPSSVRHGTSLGRGRWHVTPGRWQCLEQAVRLNTPGRADGRLEVWLDDRPVLAVSNLVYRTTSALRIDGVFFSTFFGGDDPSWASPKDQHVDFADLSVGSARLRAPRGA